MPACAVCGLPRPCSCDSADWRADKEARAFAAAHGERIPSETDRRLLGGNVDRSDRGDPQEHLRRLERQRQTRRDLEAQREIIAMRARAIRDGLAELPGLERDEKILGMFLAGAEFQDIARAFGNVSHSWASRQIARIRDEALARGGPDRANVATPCRCGRVGCVIVTRAGTGRPRRYKSDKCRSHACNRRFVERRRRRSRVARTLSRTPDTESAA